MSALPPCVDGSGLARTFFTSAAKSQGSWWLVVDGKSVDLCQVDPGFEVDLHVRSNLRSMTAVWMGLLTLKAEMDAGRIELTGDKMLAHSMQRWLGLSPFAKEKTASRASRSALASPRNGCAPGSATAIRDIEVVVWRPSQR